MFCEPDPLGLAFACPDPECSLFFNEMSVLRRHIKLEHLTKWSLRRSLRRANVVDVDIPEEGSQFAELKTMTEDVGRKERATSRVFSKAAEWRKTEQWREG